MKSLYILLTLILLSSCSGDDKSNDETDSLQHTFSSKPTDKQVLSFLKKEGRYDIELTKDGGKYSTYELRKRWQKGYAYKINANIKQSPNAVLQVGGFVRFEVNGSNYDFAAIKQLTTQITGLEPPKEEVLLAIINNNMQKFHSNYRNIVFEQPLIKLPENIEDRTIFWHSSLSFSISFNMTFYIKSGGSKIDKKHCVKKVRFYRKDVNSPFDKLLQQGNKCETLESKRYSYDEFDKIPSLSTIKGNRE